MNAQDAEQVRAWLRSKEGIRATTDELDKAGKAGRSAGRATKAGFKEAAQQVDATSKITATLISRFTGVGAAIGGITMFSQIVKAEYEELLQRQQEAAGAQTNIFPSYARAAATLPGFDPDKMYKQVIRESRGVNPEAIFNAIEAGSAARGDLPEQGVVDAAIASSRLGVQYTGETRNAWVASSLENMKTFGGTPEENLAMNSEAFRASRAKDAGSYFRNVAPAIPQMASLAKSKDYKLMASTAIGLGAAMGDQEGGPGATAAIQLVRQVITEAVASGKAKKTDDYETMLAVVRGDPKIQSKLRGVFAESLGTSEADLKKAAKAGKGQLAIEAKAFSAAHDYLSPNQDPATNAAAREIQAAAGKLNSPQVALAKLTALNERISKAGPGPTENVTRTDTQRENERKLGKVDEGQMGALMTFYDNRMKDMGQWATKRGLERAEVFTRSDTPEELAENVRVGLRRQAEKNLRTAITSNSREGSQEITKMTETLERMLAVMQEEKGPQKVEVVNGRTNQPAASPAGALGDK